MPDSDRASARFIEAVGAGRPLATVHTPGLDHNVFRPWLDDLSDVTRVVYFDHGGSGKHGGADAGPATFAGWVDDMDRLREQLHLDRWLVLGHSFGGMIALEYALANPSRVDGLVLCATPPTSR